MTDCYLVLLAFTAGVMDSVVGDASLLFLLGLIATGVRPQTAIALTKINDVLGALVASVEFFHRGATVAHVKGRIDRRGARAMAIALVLAIIGASAGASVFISCTEPGGSRAVVVVAVLNVAALVVMALHCFRRERIEGADHIKWPAVYVISLVTSAYDGLMGLGAGIITLIGLTKVARVPFLEATGTVKILSIAANASVVVRYMVNGDLSLHEDATLLLIASMAGSYVGAAFVCSGRNGEIFKAMWTTAYRRDDAATGSSMKGALSIVTVNPDAPPERLILGNRSSNPHGAFGPKDANGRRRSPSHVVRSVSEPE